MAAEVAGGQNRLIIAIDYGTTYTGIAYKRIAHTQNVVEASTIDYLTDWGGNYAEPKVPSVISYSPTHGHYSNWGANIDPTALKMSWTKLQLDEQSRGQELEWILDALQNMRVGMESLGNRRRMPTYPANNPVDVVSDYLIKIREVTIGHLRRRFGAVFDTLPKEIVVTIPAQWSDEAKNLTFRAFTKAGFNIRYFKNLEGMYLISEPEAAALYCAKVLMPRDPYEAEDFLAPGDCFVQADLGGGTVDCISYMVTETSPSMKLRQMGEATTAKCGATFIDLEFIKLLGRKLGPDYFAMLSDGRPVESFSANSAFNEGVSEMLLQFDQLKRDYDGNAESTKLTLPGDLYELTNPDRGIIEGEITITNDDMRRVFEFSLNTTMELISAQTTQIQIHGHPTKRIFLSGGFSENQYVRDAIEEFGQIMNIRVNWPPQPTVAVVRGAVARRIEDLAGSGVRMTECPKSYGICVSQPYSPYLHENVDVYKDPYDDQYKARNQMLWLKNKGDLILSNTPAVSVTQLCRKFSLNDPRTFITDLVEYQDAVQGIDPQHRMQRFMMIPSARRRIIPIRYNLSDIPKDLLAGPKVAGMPNHFCAFLKLRLEIKAGGQGSAAIHLSTRQIATVNINQPSTRPPSIPMHQAVPG